MKNLDDRVADLEEKVRLIEERQKQSAMRDEMNTWLLNEKQKEAQEALLRAKEILLRLQRIGGNLSAEIQRDLEQVERTQTQVSAGSDLNFAAFGEAQPRADLD